MRFFTAWLILFGSKFVMLGAVDFAFGDDVSFGGPLHGVVSFIEIGRASCRGRGLVAGGGG